MHPEFAAGICKWSEKSNKVYTLSHLASILPEDDASALHCAAESHFSPAPSLSEALMRCARLQSCHSCRQRFVAPQRTVPFFLLPAHQRRCPDCR